jgi:hypothetical protein
MQSLTISIYLGSKIFRGTVVLGKIMKLLNGKTAIFFGKSSFFILFITIAYLILLELKKTANYNIFMRV